MRHLVDDDDWADKKLSTSSEKKSLFRPRRQIVGTSPFTRNSDDQKLKVTKAISPLAETTKPAALDNGVVELMCDEKIEDNTPDNSPEGKEETVPEISVAHPNLVKNLKMNLIRKLSEAGRQPEEPKAISLTDYDDFLDKSEIHKPSVEEKKEKATKKSKVDKSKRSKEVDDEIKAKRICKSEDNSKLKTNKAYKLENIKFIEGVGSMQVNI